MKRHTVCLQLKFEAQKDFQLATTSRLSALNGNASLVLLPPFLVDYMYYICVGQFVENRIEPVFLRTFHYLCQTNSDIHKILAV